MTLALKNLACRHTQELWMAIQHVQYSTADSPHAYWFLATPIYLFFCVAGLRLYTGPSLARNGPIP